MTSKRGMIMWMLPAVLMLGGLPAAADAQGLPRLTPDVAASLSKLALQCIGREYPNKPGHVMNDESEVHNPQTLHPVFYGCFDWHSAVHGHWMLVRLLKEFPDLDGAGEIRAAISRNITAANVAGEVAYLSQPSRQSFERTYGWAWLLKLAEELHGWDDPDGRQWYADLEPLTQAMVARYVDFLPRQKYPIRRGVHANTAFGIAFALDYAHAVGHQELRDLLNARALSYFGEDSNYPGGWEPGGDDFFSPAMMEADLMRRVLGADGFALWMDGFLPALGSGEPKSLLTPAEVTDRTDPKIVHLDGLNLSRAWCMIGIANALPQDHAYDAILRAAANQHARDALAHIVSGNYEGEHWLASFAVYTLVAMGAARE